MNDILNPQSLPSTLVENAEQPDIREPSLPMIGFFLSKFVLWIISGFVACLIIFLLVKQFDATPGIKVSSPANMSDSSYRREFELIKLMQDEKKSYRDFILQITQMILLNLLLPVLTAILGYIFASNNKGKE